MKNGDSLLTSTIEDQISQNGRGKKTLFTTEIENCEQYQYLESIIKNEGIKKRQTESHKALLAYAKFITLLPEDTTQYNKNNIQSSCTYNFKIRYEIWQMTERWTEEVKKLVKYQ